MGLTDIELKRLQRIEENKKRMQELGLTDAVQAVAATNAAQQARGAAAGGPPRQRRAAPQFIEVEVRRSGRDKKSVNYSERDLFKVAEKALHVAERRSTVRVKKSGGGGGGKVSVRVRGWQPCFGEAGHVAMVRCLEAAEECVAGLSNPAVVKVMTASMVSGGFWCSAPKELIQLVGKDHKCVFTAFLPEGQAVPENATRLNAAGDGWDIVWLPHGNKGSFGFSGNWVGFAVDNKLFPGDCVVCELLPPAEGPTCFRLVFHVHRALDHETDKEREARLATMANWAQAEEEVEAEAAAGQEEGRGKDEDEPAAVAAAAVEFSQEVSPAIQQQQQQVVEEERQQQGAEQRQQGKEAEMADDPSGSKRKQQTHIAKGTSKRQRRVTPDCQAGTAAQEPKAKQQQQQPNKAAAVKKRTCDPGVQQQQQQQPAKKKRASGKRAPAGAAQAAKQAEQQQQQAGEQLAEQQQAQQPAQQGEEGEARQQGMEEQEEEFYDVESILGVKGRGAGRMVHIKWVGYEDTTWEPASMLDQPLHTYVLAPGVKL